MLCQSNCLLACFLGIKNKKTISARPAGSEDAEEEEASQQASQLVVT